MAPHHRVDEGGAAFQSPCDLLAACGVTREHGTAQAESRPIRQPYRIVGVGGGNDGRDGSENLLVERHRPLAHVGQDGRGVIKARSVRRLATQ